MAIISFWSNKRGETGKSTSIAAIATYLAVQHNYKILILDTKYENYFYQDCYWKEDRGNSFFRKNSSNVSVESGISGLTKAVRSNKISPEIITNYTRIIFKDRLELLAEEDSTIKEDYEIHKRIFKDIAKMATRYYDLVFVDVDTNLGDSIADSILEASDLIIANLTQKKRQIDEFLEIRKEKMLLKDKAIIPLLGRYDQFSKFTAKNVSRYMKEREPVSVIPYNTLFFESCNDGTVADFFIKFRNINPKDKNAGFIEDVQKSAERIIDKLQKLQMKM